MANHKTKGKMTENKHRKGSYHPNLCVGCTRIAAYCYLRTLYIESIFYVDGQVFYDSPLGSRSIVFIGSVGGQLARLSTN